jgi:tetratricopeptide (TPR) repeat protein
MPQDQWGHDRFLPELTSGDAARVAKAVQDIEAKARKTSPYKYRATVLQVLVDAKLYDQADAMALRLIVFDPFHSDSVAALEKLRARALFGENRPAESLAAAKAYYNAALLKDTGDAIDTVALYLIKTRPDDPGIGRRFKKQQVAGVQTSPTAPADSPAPDDLGQPILPTIKIDPAPFTAALTKITGEDFKSLVMKGNLLLVSDDLKEARGAFEQAYVAAPEDKSADAIENVARSIRAQSGCVGPANAYILSERSAAGGADGK